MKYEKKINIFVNGQKYQCSKSITLLNLLSYLNYQPSLLVIEYIGKLSGPVCLIKRLPN